MTATDKTRTAEADADESVVLLVLARERPAVARRLLEHALDPAVVRTTSEGYVVPRSVAEAAGLVLPDPVDQAVGVATVENGAPAHPVSAADLDDDGGVDPAHDQDDADPAEVDDDQGDASASSAAPRGRRGKGGK